MWEFDEAAVGATEECVSVDPVWPSNYNAFLTRVEAEAITQIEDAAGALHATGKLGADSTLVRIAYIRRVLGSAAATAAEEAFDEAYANAPANRGRVRGRQAVKELFLTAWGEARSRWEQEEKEIAAAHRITGPTFRVIREGLGLSQAELARRLRVSGRSVRGWEDGEALTPRGVTTEMWGLWDTWITEVVESLPADNVFPANVDPRLLAAAAILQSGMNHRFNVQRPRRMLD